MLDKLDDYNYNLFNVSYVPHFESAVNEHDVVVLKALINGAVKPNIQCIEIGTWDGFSASIIGEIIKPYDGNLYCIDPYFGDALINPSLPWGTAREKLLQWHDNINAKRLQYHVFHMKLPAHKMANHLKDEDFDFIFIDGSHHYEWVKYRSAKDRAASYPTNCLRLTAGLTSGQ